MTLSHLVNRFIIKSLIDLCLWHLGFNLWTTQNKTIKINQRKILLYKNRMNRWMMPTIRIMIIRPPSRSFSPRSRLAEGSSLKAVPHGSLSGGTWSDSSFIFRSRHMYMYNCTCWYTSTYWCTALQSVSGWLAVYCIEYRLGNYNKYEYCSWTLVIPMNNPQRVKNRDHCGRELQDPTNRLKVLGCGSKVSMQFLSMGTNWEITWIPAGYSYVTPPGESHLKMAIFVMTSNRHVFIFSSIALYHHRHHHHTS